VDWRENAQLKLWSTFIKAGYVTEQLHEVLRDSLAMYPDLDRVSLYCLVRQFQPKHVFEIGSGESTYIVRQALRDGSIHSAHVSVEPYRADEVPADVRVVTQEVQELDDTFFDVLAQDDILFIDSSHVTMPYGDTLTELLTILPRLNKGVLVHIHDIFLPYDYPQNWFKKNYVYTEQWLVALMLYGAGGEWEIVWHSALMCKRHSAQILKMPSYPLRLGQTSPKGGSLWLRKLGEPTRQ
tara:strand:- start:3068 stop:3784 length:717 start_codon:yes stop_codon:yes gene_type:complete